MKEILHSLIRWWDSRSEVKSTEIGEYKNVDWLRCLPFVFLHITCFGVIWVGWSWAALWTAVILYLVRMFAITGFYHRYFSHRSFKTSRSIQFLFAILGNASVQRGPLWWAAHHRYHHMNSDKSTDIHSPRQDGFWWSHMFWFMNQKNFSLRSELVKDFMKYPELRFIDRFDILVPLVFACFLFIFGNILEAAFPELETSGPQILIWGFCISTVILFHTTCATNSLAHIFGQQPFPTQDDSKNNFLVAILTLGEGWHNNHHWSPSSVRQGFEWWQLDFTYYVLMIFSWFGLIWDLNLNTRPVIRSSKQI